jgi:hypothetical protein
MSKEVRFSRSLYLSIIIERYRLVYVRFTLFGEAALTTHGSKKIS